MEPVRTAVSGELARSRPTLPHRATGTLVAPAMVGVAIADAGVPTLPVAGETDPLLALPALDALDVPGNFPQDASAPRDLCRVHDTPLLPDMIASEKRSS